MGFVAEPGKVLDGRYLLRTPLGHGGMGTVWRAEHTQLKTPVAVKLVSASIASRPETLARFRREAQVAAALESANIVRILDYGIQDSTPYIAMELLQGETLAARLAQRGALGPDVTLRIASQAARGISRAHQAQVFHCDLKPENIFLAQVDGEEIAKLLDFGVAKAPLLDPLTQTGAVLGTLQYMSPEQLEGRRGIDARSDLYSLAVIVFECICGQPAFRAASIAELVRRICGAPLPAPSSIANVSSAFDEWFFRAAHRDPAARYSSARELVDALVVALEGSSARSGVVLPPTPSEPSMAMQPTMVASRGGGSEKAGYRLTPDPRSRVLEVELWGMHDVPLAEAARDAFFAAFEIMKQGGPWVTIAFGGRHPPQSAAVQKVEGDTMAEAGAAGLARIAFVIDSALAKMSARRLSTESGMPNARFFGDECEARAWLADAPIFTRMGGNDRAGYRVHTNPYSKILRLELWGLWDLPVADAFRTEIKRAYVDMGSGPWVALANSRRYVPQKLEIQRVHEEVMALAPKHGLVRVAQLLDSAVSQMQIKRLFEEAGSPPHLRFFTDESQARAWLQALVTVRGGDDQVGFRITRDMLTRIVEIERWGLWDVSVGSDFKKQLLDVCEVMKGAPWAGLSFATRHPPQKPEVQKIQGDTMALAKSYGCVRAAMVVESALAAMMVRRLTQENHMDIARIFTDEKEARAWLAELGLRG